MTMANIDSTSKRVDDSSLPSKRRVHRVRKPREGRNPSKASSSASAAVQNSARGSILWTLLLAGLVFSLIDLFYIANYLERTANVPSSDPIIKPSVFLIPSGVGSLKDGNSHPEKSSSNIEHPSNRGTAEKPADESKNQAKGPIHISTPIIKSSASQDANIGNLNQPNPGESSSDTNKHAATGRSGPIHIGAPVANASAFSGTNEMEIPRPHPESSSEHGEHTTTKRSLEQPKEDRKDQEKGPIRISVPVANASAFSSTDEVDIPKDEPPRLHPEESISDTKHTATGNSVEKPKDVSKAQMKAPIQIKANHPQAFSSTDKMKSPKDEPPRPQPKESSSKRGEHATTERTLEKPKEGSKDQAKEPIHISTPVANTSAFSRADEMDISRDEPPRPDPVESSLEQGQHTTTAHSMEQPKDVSKDQDKVSIEIDDPVNARAFSSIDEMELDKRPILLLLKEAGIDLDDLDQTVIDSLPLWSTVVKLYGDEPRIVGLDTCEAFQATGDPADHFLGVAGTFNTGTNLMAELFIANCHMPARMAKYGKVNRGIRWQVPWGKHTPVADESLRLNHKTEKDSGVDPNSVFPAVTVRDPAAWMQSMCRHEYAMTWPHNKTLHCPNLVPDGPNDYMPSTLTNFANSTNSSVPVKVQYKGFTVKHDSMLHHWNEYYEAYTATATFPHVVVRFEDLIFHPVAVTTAVCECAGGALNREFKYVTGSAKKGDAHGKEKTGYIDAIIRYGNDRGDRWKGMTEADLTYTRKYLDPTLMDLFGYHYPPATNTTRI